MRGQADWQMLQPVLKTQREMLTEVLLCAARYDVWMTLEEPAHKTRYPEANISAQLRHLRKPHYGGSLVGEASEALGGDYAAEHAREGVGVPDEVWAVGGSAKHRSNELKKQRGNESMQ